MENYTFLYEGHEGNVYVDRKSKQVMKKMKLLQPFSCLYWKQLSNPSIPRFISSEIKDGKEYIVSEYVEGKDLMDTMMAAESLGQCISLGSKLCVIKQILAVVKSLHDKDVAHGDIKPDNIILLDDWKNIRVIDLNQCFGIKNVFFEDMLNEQDRTIENKNSSTDSGVARGHIRIHGTFEYLAPELISIYGKPLRDIPVCTREGALRIYKAGDIYALGQTISCMIGNVHSPDDIRSVLYNNVALILRQCMLNQNYQHRASIGDCVKLFAAETLDKSSFNIGSILST